jgi:NAD(P)-dependent dehydrogenase (short-subunit alcohol dehydrogenase family)
MSADPPQVVLVTGATGALGTAVVRRFAAEGARLALVGRDEDRLREVADETDLAADAWMPVLGELTDRAAAQAVVDAVEARFGRVDVLVHLVGGWAGGTAVADLDPGEVGRMLDQHLWTTLHVTQAAVPGMVQRGFGRVLSVTTPFASNPAANGASYAIGKAAQETLLRTLARETAGSGVTVNVVQVRKIDAKHEREAEPTAKNGTWTTPEEIAEAFASLASPAGEAITGARIPLDGRG